MSKKGRNWAVVGILLWFSMSACTVRQQQQVLGTIGAVIPGSSTSVLTSSPSQAKSEPTYPEPQPDPDRVDAQWVLRTMQRAMTDNPPPFQGCLDNPPCKLALTAHLIRLQKQAGGTLELPTVYDRYDLKRGKE
ncbi:MAG TPA: hypothetical protein VGX03_12000 [Candidatus Binatia bacterium]|nr:hypothetical protein [Candidatus Binatia bacterium]